MNFKDFDNSTAIADLVSAYETTVQEGATAFYDETTFLQLVDYYEEEAMLNRALEVADQAIACHQFSSSLYVRKAALLINIRQERDALDLLDRAELLAPNSVSVQLLRAEAMAFMNEGATALIILEDLKQCTSDAEQLSSIFVTESLVYEKLELYDQMFYTLKAALTENPDNQDALERLWLCVELSKSYEESVILHEQILEHNAYSYVAWYNLGHAYAYLGRYEEAIEAYEYAYLINENFEFAYRDCAEICFELNYYDQALKCYKEVLEHFDPDSDLYLRIGQCYQHFGKIRLARNYYTRAALLDPVNDEVFFRIGECYAAEEKWEHSIRFYQKAIAIEDKREEYFGGLGAAYASLGQQTEAEAQFREATEIAPEQPKYWFNYANFLIEIGEEQEAIELLEEAESYAISIELSYCRIACLLTSGRRTEALKHLHELLEDTTDQYDLLFDLVPGLENDSGVLTIISSYLS